MKEVHARNASVASSLFTHAFVVDVYIPAGMYCEHQPEELALAVEFSVSICRFP